MIYISLARMNKVQRFLKSTRCMWPMHLTCTFPALLQQPELKQTRFKTESKRHFHVITPTEPSESDTQSDRKKLRKLSCSQFWDDVYEKKNAPEWYMGSETAAEFIAGVIKGKGLLNEEDGTHLIELGCGSSPIVPALLTELGSVDAVGYCTDISTVCVEQLKALYQEPCQTVQFHCLDVSNLSSFISSKTQSDSSGTVMVIEKGCLDALIWDSKLDILSTLSAAPWNSLLSISGEDPDIRMVFLQELFTECDISVACLGDKDLFCYSVIKQ